MMRSSFAVLLAIASAALAAPLNFTSVAKRDEENVQFTWFEVGLGACGGWNNDNEYVSRPDGVREVMFTDHSRMFRSLH